MTLRRGERGRSVRLSEAPLIRENVWRDCVNSGVSTCEVDGGWRDVRGAQGGGGGGGGAIDRCDYMLYITFIRFNSLTFLSTLMFGASIVDRCHRLILNILISCCAAN